METFGLLMSTILFRPYVFVLLGLYFVAGGLQLGMKRITVFTILAYVIAFVSEYCSTRIGIPYGYYHYILFSKVGPEDGVVYRMRRECPYGACVLFCKYGLYLVGNILYR